MANVAGPAEYHSSSMTPMRDTIILAVCFLCVFSSFEALQSLQSSLHHQQGLGVTSLAFLYTGLVVASVFTPAIIYNVGVKNSLMLAWLGHGIYVLSNVYPHWATLMPGSFLLGFVSCPLWTSARICLSALATVSVQQDSQKVPEKVTTIHVAFSRLNGVFTAIFSAAFLFGNTLSSTILFQSAYNQSEASQALQCGVDYCPRGGVGQHVAPPQHLIVYIMLGEMLTLCCCVTGHSSRVEGIELATPLETCFRTYSGCSIYVLISYFLRRGIL